MELTIIRNTSGINKKKTPTGYGVIYLFVFLVFCVGYFQKSYKDSRKILFDNKWFFYKGNAANANEHN